MNSSLQSFYHLALSEDSFVVDEVSNEYVPQQVTFTLMQQNIQNTNDELGESCQKQSLESVDENCLLLPTVPVDDCPNVHMYKWNEAMSVSELNESSRTRSHAVQNLGKVEGLGCQYSTATDLLPGLYQVQVDHLAYKRFTFHTQLTHEGSACGNFIVEAGEDCDIGSGYDDDSFCRHCLFSSGDSIGDQICDQGESSTDCTLSAEASDVDVLALVNHRHSASFVDQQNLQKAQTYLYTFDIHANQQHVQIEMNHCSTDADGIQLQLYKMDTTEQLQEILNQLEEDAEAASYSLPVALAEGLTGLDLNVSNLNQPRGVCGRFDLSLDTGYYVLAVSNQSIDLDSPVDHVGSNTIYSYQLSMTRMHTLQQGYATGDGLFLDQAQSDWEKHTTSNDEPISRWKVVQTVTQDDDWNNLFRVDVDTDQQIVFHVYDDVRYRQCESRRTFDLTVYPINQQENQGWLMRNQMHTLVEGNHLEATAENYDADHLPVAELNQLKPCFQKVVVNLSQGSYLVGLKMLADAESFLWTRQPYLMQVYLPSYCGNGTVDEMEECDDGNTDNDDGCSKECFVEETCQTGECTTCGNGIIEEGEACDDGNQVHNDTCNLFCQKTEHVIMHSLYNTSDSLYYIHDETQTTYMNQADYCALKDETLEEDNEEAREIQSMDTDQLFGNEKRYYITLSPQSSLEVKLCTQNHSENADQLPGQTLDWNTQDLKVKLHLYDLSETQAEEGNPNLVECVLPDYTHSTTDQQALKICNHSDGNSMTEDHLSDFAETDRPSLTISSVQAGDLEQCVLYRWENLNQSDGKKSMILKVMPQLDRLQQHVYRRPKIDYHMSVKIWRDLKQTWTVNTDLLKDFYDTYQNTPLEDLSLENYLSIIRQYSNVYHEQLAEGEDVLYRVQWDPSVNSSDVFEMRTFSTPQVSFQQPIDPFVCPFNTFTQIVAYQSMTEDEDVSCQNTYPIAQQACDWNQWSFTANQEYFILVRQIERNETFVGEALFSTQLRSIFTAEVDEDEQRQGCGNGRVDRGEECDFMRTPDTCSKHCHCIYGYANYDELSSNVEVSTLNGLTELTTDDPDTPFELCKTNELSDVGQ